MAVRALGLEQDSTQPKDGDKEVHRRLLDRPRRSFPTVTRKARVVVEVKDDVGQLVAQHGPCAERLYGERRVDRHVEARASRRLRT